MRRACVLALALVGCQGWGQSYAPEYMSDIESATGEFSGSGARRTYCACSWDSNYGEVQFACEPRGQDSYDTLYFYFPMPSSPYLRANFGADVQVSYADHPGSLSGFGYAYIQLSYGKNLGQDPRSDIFSRVSFPLFVHHLYLPEQRVYSYGDLSVYRDLVDSSLTDGAFWCEDYQATLGSYFRQDAQLWQRIEQGWAARARALALGEVSGAGPVSARIEEVQR